MIGCVWMPPSGFTTHLKMTVIGRVPFIFEGHATAVLAPGIGRLRRLALLRVAFVLGSRVQVVAPVTLGDSGPAGRGADVQT